MTLNLPEKLLLLGLNDEKGSVVFSSSTALPYGLAGAILLELLFQKRLHLLDDKISVIDRKPTGDALLDETLALITASEKPRKAKYWVNKIHGKIKKVQDRLAEGLVEKGILQKEEKKILWLIPYHRYPAKNMTEELAIRDKIRNAVFNHRDVDEQLLSLISLMHTCQLTNEVFDKSERKTAKKSIKEMSKSELVSKAVSDAVDAANAAIIAVIAASAATSSAASS